MFTNKSTEQIFQDHMQKTDPLLLRIQRNGGEDEYKSLHNQPVKNKYLHALAASIGTVIMIVIVVLFVLIVLSIF